jgi:hypothetical protein
MDDDTDDQRDESSDTGDGGDEDGDLDFGAADGDGFFGDQGDGAASGADDWADGDGAASDGNGDGASDEGLVGAAGYSAYEPSPYQIRHTNSATEIAAFAALDTVGAAGDGVVSLLAHGVGAVDGLLGDDQGAANWHDLGAKWLENGRAMARNAMRDVGVMEGDREVRPYPDGHDQCPVPHGS